MIIAVRTTPSQVHSHTGMKGATIKNQKTGWPFSGFWRTRSACLPTALTILIAASCTLGGCPMEGADGPVGDAGQPAPAVSGQQGPTGTQGEQGPQGDFGLQGPRGEAGLEGDTGPPGETGLDGETGPQGELGLQGETGPQGEMGLQGETGPQGELGLQGETGPPGETGLSGAPGASPFTLMGLDAVYTQGNVGIGSDAPTAQLELVGGASSIVFDTEATGDDSVVLPTNAISAAETLDEPGVATANANVAVALSGGVETILSRTITVPESGYVFAIATCQANGNHTNGTATIALFGVSDTAGVIPATQDVAFVISSAYPTGALRVPVTVQAIFTVASGANTFYFLGDEWVGNVSVNDMTLSLIYFPTAYGSVDLP